jgi:beta-glucosidase
MYPRSRGANLIGSSIFLLILGVSTILPAQSTQDSKVIDAKVEALLKRMTLEEKVGQMTQVTLEVVSQGKESAASGPSHQVDPAKLATAIHKYHVGSILNANGHAYTLDHWHEVINAIQDQAAKTRLHIPVLYGIDSIHGANYVIGATLFPQSIAMAATWNPQLAERAGEISAFQTRAAGIPWDFYPVMDIGRQPLWSRFWETYGEDVFLASSIGKSYIRGLQGDDIGSGTKVAACLKHYVGYSFPFNGKDRTPAVIDDRMMKQYFLPTFEAGVRDGVQTVMVNSAEVNGIPGHANRHLITDVLKNEWGFRGFVVSDWADIKNLYTRDHVAASPKDAVRMSVMAGVDMSMVPLDFSFYDLLLENVKDGSVPVPRIDDAVRRILRVKFMTGLFVNARPDQSLASRFDPSEFQQANLNAAHEAITLLKNEQGTLPLKKGQKILVTGPTANLLSSLNGGWTFTWQGNEESLYPQAKLTILHAIERLAGAENVSYMPGTTFDKEVDIPAAVQAAQKADIVIAAIGETAYCETPGNISDLTLDEAQLHLVSELAKTGKPIILVLAEGRPRVIHRIVPMASAIVMAYLPGLEGGPAIADVLFGDVNPSGRLPMSYPAFPNGFSTYDHKMIESRENKPAWEFPFGYGLSYTRFVYSDLKLSDVDLRRKGSIIATVSVKNVGERAGKEVVQLFVSQLFRSVSPPNKELKGFQKIELKAGESKAVSFKLTSADLAFVGEDNRWHTESGPFKVMVAEQSASFTLR